ncbi:M90 family metallopeptidase [Fodinibius sp.]|uniref:M90 family metallopeptidase n=1 Tax=Fodinibius sp. TaxID=1872440 RepID=UPI002ACD7470|nr:M90 family metallopeptidase [Fodinibius sp.]MDZ7659904.1 M90 family metallopeptidase [Fodinibius sp.]
MFGFKKWRRKRLLKKSFTDDQLAILKKNVPYYHHLPLHLQEKLVGLTQIFLDEKRFEGCAGLEVTEEIRISIAAQASILLLGTDDLSYFYEDLRSVLVYPKKYVAKVKKRNNGIFVEEGFEQRHGEAWSHGYVILAWNEVQQGASDIRDGQNLVFHEFAHQLDYEYGATEQIESQNADSSYLSWAKVLGREYNNFLNKLKQNQQSLIDEYGATNPAEFFAVVTELFFEKPKQLKNKHPQLYSQLTEFYQQDPAAYLKS